MASRLDLHNKLKEVLGSNNVYFQPPPSKSMNYPAIVYALSDINNVFANDSVYKQSRSYEITLIDPNPDSEYITKLSRLPTCRFNRHYKADNLNHYLFTIFN